MGVSICIASGKDGTGKSQIAANLGTALSNMGISTLIVDGDIRGASLGLIYGVMDTKTPTIHDVLTEKVTLEKGIIESFGTKLVVGGMKIQQLVDVSLERFPQIIEQYTDLFEIVIVDSTGGLGNDAMMVINSCQSMILVLTPDINSIIHAIQTLVLAKNVGASVIGAVINRAGSPYDVPREQVEDFLNVEILGVINEDEKIKKSVHEAAPIVMGYPKSDFSEGIKEIANLLVNIEKMFE
jgi:MinD-like ATPase involved in chromosome partitioning or flagellar assembly